MQAKLAFLSMAAVSLLAQVDRANLTGVVTDAASAVVQEAKVSVESPTTGFRREAFTNQAGVYILAGLPIGNYTISISKEGFQTRRIEDVTLRVGQARTLNVELAVGATATQIEVQDTVSPLQQTNAEIGLVIDQNQMNALPLNGRNWSSFLMLAPGATNSGDGSQNSVRFMGRSRDDNNFTFDGVDATGVKDPRQEASLRLNISLDSIAEFRVSSGLYTAESGNGAGAQMNLVSKSGTNQFHGGLFEYFRNNKLDARRPIDITNPPFRLNQFGGSLGGRLVRDRTFFYTNFEALRQRLASTFIGFVPSAEFRQKAIAGSPAIKSVMDAYRPGNSRTADPNIDQLTNAASQPWSETSGLMKVDHRLSTNTSLFVRYNVDDGRIAELRNALLETRVSNFRTQNGVVQLQHIFTPNLLSETRFGANRSALRRDTLGTFNEGISIPGFVNLQVNRNEVEIGTSYAWLQNLTWIRGRHNFKFGGEIRKIDLNLGDTGQVQTSFASRDNFLLNRADSVSFSAALPGLKGLRPYYFVYAQDEWKATRALTFSFGTRYEYYSVAHTSDGRGRVFDLDRCGGFCTAGTPWYFPDRNNWAPRAGMAWSPERLGGKTVVRLGYGIFYGPGQIDDVNAAIDSYPETYTLSQRDQAALAFPAVQFLAQAKSTGVSARALQRDRRDGYSQQWTVSLQQALPMSFLLQTSYVGSNGHKLFGRSFINVIDPATGRRPYPNFSNIDIKNNLNNSSMQSLQVSLVRNLRSGLLWQTQYMWSHNISDNAGAGDGQNLMISNCRRCDRGNADWDIRHTMTTNAIYELPFGKARAHGPKSGIAGWMASGWNLSGVYFVRTGLPFSASVNRSAADLPDGVVSTAGRSAPSQRPNLVAGVPLYPASQTPSAWLNPAAFAVPARGTWGTLPRNVLRGPGLWQFDLGAGKQAAITEHMRVEFRAEMFNLFNRAQYANPNASISNSNQFGRITSVVNSNPTGFGGPRQVQFMLRLRF